MGMKERFASIEAGEQRFAPKDIRLGDFEISKGLVLRVRTAVGRVSPYVDVEVMVDDGETGESLTLSKSDYLRAFKPDLRVKSVDDIEVTGDKRAQEVKTLIVEGGFLPGFKGSKGPAHIRSKFRRKDEASDVSAVLEASRKRGLDADGFDDEGYSHAREIFRGLTIAAIEESHGKSAALRWLTQSLRTYPLSILETEPDVVANEIYGRLLNYFQLLKSNGDLMRKVFDAAKEEPFHVATLDIDGLAARIVAIDG